jgi:hypothetical protein
LLIAAGAQPVVEQALGEKFVPNDTGAVTRNRPVKFSLRWDTPSVASAIPRMSGTIRS